MLKDDRQGAGFTAFLIPWIKYEVFRVGSSSQPIPFDSRLVFSFSAAGNPDAISHQIQIVPLQPADYPFR